MKKQSKSRTASHSASRSASRSTPRSALLSQEHETSDDESEGEPLRSTMPSPLPVLRIYEADGAILDHRQLRDRISLAKIAHRTPGLQVWTGPAGVGKTVTAEQLAYECNADADAGKPHAYRAFYFMSGGDVDHSSQRQMKRGVYCVYEQLIEELTTAQLRQRSELSLAMDVVEEARAQGIQLLIIDEAGTKTGAEIRGLAYLYDVARQAHWPLTILLVGMDDLAAKVTALPVLTSRVRTMCVFLPWDDAGCLAYLSSRSPVLAGEMAVDRPVQRKAFETLIRATGRRLRELQTLVPEIEVRMGLKNAGSLLDVVTTVIGWRRDAATEAVAQACAYRDRVRDARARPTEQVRFAS